MGVVVFISPDEIKNTYENFLLDFFIDNDFKFIVSSDRLKDYIKNKNPKSIVVSSILKPIYEFQNPVKKYENNQEEETKFYNNLLKEYDSGVVRPEYSKTVLLQHPDLIDDISKIEVLINHICISNCPVAPLHYHFEHSKHSKEILLMLSLKEEYPKFCADKDLKKYWEFDGCHFELEK